MGVASGVMTRLQETFRDDPLTGLALAVGLIALATTPMAFAVLGRLNYFETRRGRTFQKPSFAATVCAMMLVMGVPAIFCALVVKSRHFDKDRYEFDPNRTDTVLDQGRGLHSVEEADEAVREKMKQLAEVRKNLVDRVKKLDEAMLTLRAAANQAPAVAKTLPAVLERLAGVRAAIGVDAPQQLIDATAPPAALLTAPGPGGSAVPVVAAPTIPAAPGVAVGGGISKGEFDAEVATVPEPQRALAAMLPLTDVPAGWEVAKLGANHLETFNAENLFEKIDGRAESFIQYDVKGMAYANLHPVGDEASDVQVYIFEMGGPLKALGKYGSEKPEGAKPVAVGAEGYTSAGSILFHAGPYYSQIVSTRDDPKFASFALELARRIAAKQAPTPEPASAGSPPSAPKGGPEAIFALLPAEPRKTGAKFVSQDVFGYSFLSDVFMADYQEGAVKWQGFLRSYASPDKAKAVFEQYLDGARKDGAEVRVVQAEGADQFVISSNIGLIDVIFRKGNALGGANGAPEAGPAEAFAKAFVKGLPATLPAVGEEQKK